MKGCHSGLTLCKWVRVMTFKKVELSFDILPPILPHILPTLTYYLPITSHITSRLPPLTYYLPITSHILPPLPYYLPITSHITSHMFFMRMKNRTQLPYLPTGTQTGHKTIFYWRLSKETKLCKSCLSLTTLCIERIDAVLTFMCDVTTWRHQKLPQRLQSLDFQSARRIFAYRRYSWRNGWR